MKKELDMERAFMHNNRLYLWGGLTSVKISVNCNWSLRMRLDIFTSNFTVK